MPEVPIPLPSTVVDEQERRERLATRARAVGIDTLLVILLLTSLLLACGIGAVSIPPGVTLRIVLEHLTPWEWSILPAPGPVDEGIIWSTRLPRALVGAACGAGLAISGLAAQSTLRNVLADPYILGISAGASTGAAAVMVFGLHTVGGPIRIGVGTGAFIGSLISLALVMGLARSAGRLTNTRVIFAGMAVNFFFSALTSLIIMLAKDPTTTRSVVFWMLGSLAGSHWTEVAIATAASGCGILGFIIIGRRIDALSLGDDIARTLGINPNRQRFLVFLLISLVVAFLVSLTGTIGFIGLVVPHLAKRMHGGIFRRSALACALTGAIIILLADLVARVAVAPGEMSIGVITALLGAPLLMLLIGRDARNDE
ncbi:iron ABC transporter permease [Schaalia sp. 19OD2882]|uniref:FecCD family ABC transporter permease n=1 Tax=Schaalia sp. 19OD2882 TaxID=2794089 RepID=UPI001C1EEE58|nr:iron ABC transporter permease [Schaalia sp. 19OD2882]QWW19666.1 iron ABC transporter permease [Schaalia sp. 19OD2882]